MTVAAHQPSRAEELPNQRRASLLALWTGLVAAPLAWAVQLQVGYAMTAHGCFPRDVPLQAPLLSGLRMGLLLGSVLAIAIALGAIALSCRSWVHSRPVDATAGRPPPIGRDGRSRFLAASGILTSVLFLIAIIFETSALLLSPLCGG